MATPCVVHHSAELRMGRDIAQRTKSSDAELDDDPLYNVTESSNSPTFRSGSPSLPALNGICLLTAEVHKAASSQDVSHLRSLLTSENVNQRLCSGTTPLFLVIASCETNPESESSRVLDSVRFLLELKADVNAESEAWPRKFLIHHSHSEGSKPVPSTGVAELRWTPLMKAASLGETAVVQLLLENGANSTSVRHDGATAYSLAVQSGYKDTASVFPLLGTLHERREKGKKHFKAFKKQVRGALNVIGNGLENICKNILKIVLCPFKYMCMCFSASLNYGDASPLGCLRGFLFLSYVVCCWPCGGKDVEFP